MTASTGEAWFERNALARVARHPSRLPAEAAPKMRGGVNRATRACAFLPRPPGFIVHAPVAVSLWLTDIEELMTFGLSTIAGFREGAFGGGPLIISKPFDVRIESVRIAEADFAEIMNVLMDGENKQAAPNYQGPTPLSSRELADALAGLCARDAERWANYISDLPKWLEPARVSRGSRGAAKAQWDPVKFARLLVARGKVSGEAVSRRFRQRSELEAWRDAWLQALQWPA